MLWKGVSCIVAHVQKVTSLHLKSFTYYLLVCLFPTHGNFFRSEVIAVYQVSCIELETIMGLLIYGWIPADSPLPWCPCACDSLCRAQHFIRQKLGTGDRCW